MQLKLFWKISSHLKLILETYLYEMNGNYYPMTYFCSINILFNTYFARWIYSKQRRWVCSRGRSYIDNYTLMFSHHHWQDDTGHLKKIHFTAKKKLYMFFVFLCIQWCPLHIVLWFCFVCLHLVYPSLCCQFLWIVHFLLPLWYSLTFIETHWQEWSLSSF